ncbi:MAG TPA: N-acetylmuramic acid 6-phosphate etherase [Aggregatilineales bacterium]|nr:N-acetylmuramic acid 6-phosphate etherase [Aggregatilineales bacterium]
MSQYIIGVNGGGTHTDFVLVDETLKVLARTETGPSNYHNVGLEAARTALMHGIQDIIRAAGIAPNQVTGIGAGMSGSDRPADHDIFRELFAAACPRASVTLDNDAVAALVAGVGRRFGVVVISGTGRISVGFDEIGNRARAGGWGYLIGPAGGGYAIGLEIVAAIASATDRTGPETALSGRVLRRLGLNAPTDLISWMYAPERKVEHIAALAAEAISLAGEDPVAGAILSQAADELASDAISVAQRLKLVEFPLVLSGGLFRYSELLRDLVTLRVQVQFSRAFPVPGDHDAAIGAAMLSLLSLGIAFPPPEFHVETTDPATERRNPLSMEIDSRPTLDLVSIMNIEDDRVASLIRAQLPSIAALIDAAAERFGAGGRLFYVGAGTSGRLGVLDASECAPTFGTSPGQVLGIMAGGPDALTDSVEGAEDSEAGGRAAIAAHDVGSHDTVVGVAASGRTPFVIGALREAVERKALTGSLVSVVDAPISAIAAHPIVVATGAEVLTGSTRLKAGTAAKLVLNMISTGVMARTGHIYSNLMVDVQASNSKLQRRAQVIVAEATGRSLNEAADLLERSDGQIKTAIVVAKLNVSVEEARSRLTRCAGNLSKSLEGSKF